jgi:hypothetical protein
MRRLILSLALVFAVLPAAGREIAGIELAEQYRLPDDPAAAPLVLNGAGVRNWFFLEIYVGALYLPQRLNHPQAILADSGPKSLRLHFLRDLSAERVKYAWHEGLHHNLKEKEREALAPRLRAFFEMLGPARRGEIVHLDYHPAHGTAIRHNGRHLGTIPGADFHQALLKVYLGEHPEDENLKRALLGWKE